MEHLTNIQLSLAITHSGFFTTAKLNPTSRLLLLTLANFYNSQNGKLFPSVAKLAKACGCSHQVISRSLNELEEEHIIQRMRALGKSNHYKFTMHFLTLLLCTKSASTMHEKCNKHDNNMRNFNKKNFQKTTEYSPISTEESKKTIKSIVRDREISTKSQNLPIPEEFLNIKEQLLKLRKG